MDVFEEYTGLAYVGRAVLRNEAEPSTSEYETMSDFQNEHPTLRPHIFVDYNEGGVSLRDVLMDGGSLNIKGSSGVIVEYQKEVRDRNEKPEVEKWRERHTLEMLEGRNIDMFTDKSESELMNDLTSGGPFVILDASEVELDVPLQPETMREELRWLEDASDGRVTLDEKSDAEIRTLYNNAQNMG